MTVASPSHTEQSVATPADPSVVTPVRGPDFQKITLNGSTLKTAQRIHAALILLLPLVGTVAAFALLPMTGFGLLELGLLVVMFLATMLGISVGFHRLLAHGAFQAPTPVQAMLLICGCMAAQGGPVYWVSNHRRHHHFSDKPGDPHSPFYDGMTPLEGLRGLWHSHIEWTLTHELTNSLFYCRDLIKDARLNRLNRLYFVWVVLGLVLPAAIGGLYHGTWMGALSGFLWGGMVRLFLSFHATSSINSITHRFGSRPFRTREHSTNNAWLALITVGESWHNNHHAFQTSAFFGLKWWQVDLGAWLVWSLQKLGLAKNVRRPTPEMIQAKLAEP